MKEKVNHIVNWIKDYADKNHKTSLVVGVSGGIDSSVVSTLCAKTGLKTIPIVMTIKNKDMLALEHAWWLEENYENVSRRIINLEKIFHEFENASKYLGADSEHAFANSRSRLRMMMLYQVATSNNGLVVGTGNKVEDFGVGFYTKYGDGGVDIAPIADCTKNEVWEIGKELGILEDIVTAIPTDGLWDDGRTDENQMGLTYTQIEEAMKNKKSKFYKKYSKIRIMNLHKMSPIPVCKIKKNVK